ncbi:224_t:CDS:2 [Funneliformis mosseae]|uniref:224_t:CDS:1 n=1 Tax=Funneliformis mosseae TaxID=27381 RepID=A0A9N9B3H4_FUNMO|nr:224_t:CDS:2 [Funneliformis mosseae]
MIFHWIGSTFKYATLSANEEQTFVVKACFIRSGVYDINRWRLTVNYNQSATDKSNIGGEHHGGLGKKSEGGGGMKGERTHK